jgi:hypothetical protein
MVASYPDRHRWHNYPLNGEMIDIRLRGQSAEDRHPLPGGKAAKPGREGADVGTEGWEDIL